MLRVDDHRIYVVPGVAGLVLLAYWAFAPRVAEVRVADAEVKGVHDRPSSPAIPQGDDASTIPQPQGDARTKNDAEASARPGLGAPRATVRDRALADALRATLRARTKAAAGADAPEDEAVRGEIPKLARDKLDAEYIRTRIREDFLPIAQECYASALTDDPRLSGTVIMTFSIVGDEDVGGVVDEAEVAPGTALQHPELLECMRESILGLSFPAPVQGGRTVGVTYPFKFSPEEP